MKISIRFLVIFLTVFLIQSHSFAQSVSVNWPLTSVGSATISSGHVTTSTVTPGATPTNIYGFYSGCTFVAPPTVPAGLKLGATGVSNWAAEGTGTTAIANLTALSNGTTRYIQFTIAPTSGYTLTINSISVSAMQNNASTASQNVAVGYSTDGTNFTTFNSNGLSGNALPTNTGTNLNVFTTFSSSATLPTVTSSGAVTIRFVTWRKASSTSSATSVLLGPIVVSGTEAAVLTPDIGLSPNSINFGTIDFGTSSSSQSFTVTGSNLTDNILVTPSSGFEIRTGTNAFSASAITLNQVSGAVSATVDARFTPSAKGASSGNIACTSSGATERDVAVSGVARVNYYSKSTGNLDVTTNWGTNTDGTGTAPPDFTTAGQIYNIRNQTAPTIGASWVVSGTSSNIILGDGTNACNFTIPGSYSLTGPIDVSANATLTMQNTTLPTIGTLATGSTVDYAASSAQTLRALSYGNLKVSNTAGVSIAGSFSVSGNLTVNGSLTQSSGTATFSGSASQTISGSATTSFYNLTVNIGSSQSNILEAQSVISIAGTLTLTNGTLEISSASTLNLASWTSVPVTAGFWMNNPSASVTIGTGNTTFNGLFKMTSGTFNTGSASDQNLNCNTTATFVFEGGNVNVAGRITRANSPSGSYTQSGGTVTVATVGSTSATASSFYFGSGTSNTGSSFTMSGGTIVIQQPDVSFTSDYTILSNTSVNVNGGTVQIGNANTPAGQTFRISSSIASIYNLVIDGTTNAKYAKFNADCTISNSLTINGGSTLDLNNNTITFSGATFTNNGVLVGSLSANLSSRFNFSGASVAQTYQGTGTVGTLNDPLAGMGFSNPLGVTINSGVTNLNINRANLFTGTVTNSNKLTIGNDSAKVSYVNIGSTAAAVGTGGVFDVAPNYQLSAGLVLYYGNATNLYSTGVEIPSSRALYSLTLNNSGGGVNLTGGNISVSNTLTLTNGLLNLGSNDLNLGSSSTLSGTPSATNMIVATGSGQVKKSISSVPSTFTFPVGDNTGTAEYSPVKVTLSSGTLSSASIGVKLSNTKYSGNTSTTNYINRAWTLTGNGITNPVYTDTLTYVSADVAGTEASLVGGLYDGSKWTNLGAVDTANNRIVGTALTSFGDFTAGEAGSFLSAGNVAVTVIPQGFYNSGGYLNSRDTIHVLLASATTPYAIVDSADVILDSLTYTATATFHTAANGSYYIVVKHRSSVETWSAAGVSFTKGSTATYDFTSAASQAYGNNEVALDGGLYGIYSGDCNQDGYVDPLDLSLVDQDSFNYVGGAGLSTDVNGDQYVDPLDLSIVDQNSFNYAGIQRPTASGRVMSAKERANSLPYYQKWLESKKVSK